jgi:predicted RNase H-like HicB family nuclease
MAKAFLEKVSEGNWSAWLDVDGAVVGGQGDTQESAKADLVEAIECLKTYLAEEGRSVPELNVEKLSFELLYHA